MSEHDLTRQEAIRLGLAVIHDRGIGLILERHAPDLTVCPECRLDEFVHAEGCKLAARVEEISDWFETSTYNRGSRPHELGPLVYVTVDEPDMPEPYWDEKRGRLVSYCASNRSPIRLLVEVVREHVRSGHDQMDELKNALHEVDNEA